jgi:hypothetical protein
MFRIGRDMRLDPEDRLVQLPRSSTLCLSIATPSLERKDTPAY